MTSTEGKSTAGEHNGWLDFTYTSDTGGCTSAAVALVHMVPLIYVAINNTYLQCNRISSSKSVSDSSELSRSNLLRAPLHSTAGPSPIAHRRGCTDDAKTMGITRKGEGYMDPHRHHFTWE